MGKNMKVKTSEELVVLVKEGNKEEVSGAILELFERYKDSISFLASSYYIFGHGKSDLENECRIAFYNAIYTYDVGRDVKFKTYANVVMKNHLAMLFRRVATLIESKSDVCDLDFALNITKGTGDICKKVCNDEYLNYIKGYIIGDNVEELLLFDAIIGRVTYKELKESGKCLGNVYYKGSRLIAKIRKKLDEDDLKN
ncbi:MAG: sigma factor [Sarcina sp.]